MIVDCVADLHGHFPKLEGGDLLIVAGDLTKRDLTNERIMFLEWMAEQDYRKKIWIAGNHDNSLDGLTFRSTRPDAAEYLCDSGTEFEGFKIWGSPWTKTFEGMNPHCKAFTCETEHELADKFELIPDDVDILITHGPPYRILDKCDNGHVGSMYLKSALKYCFRPRLWVFGHIHESYGIYPYKCEKEWETQDAKIPEWGTICINASHVNERYEPVNRPIRVIL